MKTSAELEKSAALQVAALMAGGGADGAEDVRH